MLAALSPGVTPETIRKSRGLLSTPIHVYTATVPSTWDRLSSSGYCGDTLWTRRNGLGFMQPGCESDPAGGSKSSGRKLLCCFKLCNLNLGPAASHLEHSSENAETTLAQPASCLCQEMPPREPVYL